MGLCSTKCRKCENNGWTIKKMEKIDKDYRVTPAYETIHCSSCNGAGILNPNTSFVSNYTNDVSIYKIYFDYTNKFKENSVTIPKTCEDCNGFGKKYRKIERIKEYYDVKYPCSCEKGLKLSRKIETLLSRKWFNRTQSENRLLDEFLEYTRLIN